jgi:hypothetical protein
MQADTQSYRGLLRSYSRPRRGSAMVFAILVIMVVAVMGTALLARTTHAVRMAAIQQNSALAFNLAEAGAEKGLRWLKDQSIPPQGTSTVYPFGGSNGAGADQALGEGIYRVTIIPDANNATGSRPGYLIRSQGVVANRQETVELYAQTQSFGLYAFFTDYEQTASGLSLWTADMEHFEGPVHSNNTDGTNLRISWGAASAANPIFKSTVTLAGNAIVWNPSAPSTDAEWAKVASGGSSAIKLNSSRIELPDSTDEQKIAAWGSSSGFPTTTGVRVNALTSGGNPQGGIYIVGDCTITASVTTEGWQRFAIVQGSTTTTVTVKHNQAAPQTVVQVGTGAAVTYNGPNGALNGVIYCTGNITSLKGTIANSWMTNGANTGSTQRRRNAWTIAADTLGNKDITLTGHLQYQSTPDATQAADTPRNLQAPALGVVARGIYVGTSCPNDVQLNGVFLAGGRNTTNGTFQVTNYNTGLARGGIHLIGGVIQQKRGAVGTFNSSTGIIKTGYYEDYKYDTRMGLNPPPYFPYTRTYDRMSFQQSSSGPY